MAIKHQIKAKFETRNHEIVAGIIEAAGGVPPLDPHTVIKRKTAEIAVMMALLHGGDWCMQIDHQEGGHVLVRRRRQGSL